MEEIQKIMWSEYKGMVNVDQFNYMVSKRDNK